MLAFLPYWVEPVARYMVEEGLKLTGEIAGVAVVTSGVVGILLGTLLTIRWWPLRSLIRLYIEVWRGLPLIVTIFLVYYALPALHVEIEAWLAAAVALSLWGSAQIAEATRGAVESIAREQHEAAAALGFGWVGRHTFVIVPQALRRLLPPLVSLLVNVIQNTTLAALIGVGEMLTTGRQEIETLLSPPPIGTGQDHSLAIYGGVLVAFFLISFPLTRLAAFLERRLV
ncbi:MAG: amino acid ABC transporter permease [Actinobacteria bacterium]|nr:amino acid ABC transporter permease [Actinomycetota bacterium]